MGEKNKKDQVVYVDANGNVVYGQDPGAGDDGTGNPGNPGGSGGWGSPSAQQQAAAKNQGIIANWNSKTARQKYKGQMDVYDTADKQAGNRHDADLLDANRSATDDWFTQQQALQATSSSISNAAGNALKGSGLHDIYEMTEKVDDRGDVATLKSLRENMNKAHGEHFKSIADTNNARNQARLDTWDALRGMEADLAAQYNNIDPKLFLPPGTAPKKGRTGKAVGTALKGITPIAEKATGGKVKKGAKEPKLGGTDLGSKDWFRNNPAWKALVPQVQGFFDRGNTTGVRDPLTGLMSASDSYYKSNAGSYNSSRR